jgi:hypothetical protein
MIHNGMLPRIAMKQLKKSRFFAEPKKGPLLMPGRPLKKNQRHHNLLAQAPDQFLMYKCKSPLPLQAVT